MSSVCYTPDGHKRPVLNVNSKFLIYMWNVPTNVPISVIKKVGERIRFVETFEAWKNKKIGQLIIEFADQQALDKFVHKLSQKEILNFDPPVEFRIYDPKFGTRSFFDYVLQWSGVDLLACQAIPDSFDYHKKPPSNTTTRSSSSQLRASAAPFVPRTNINAPPATRQQNGTSNIQNENREFGAGNGLRPNDGGFGGGSRRRGGENETSTAQNGNKEFGAGNAIRQQSGGFGGGSRRGRGGSQIFMQSRADANNSSNNQRGVSPWPPTVEEEEEVNLNGKTATNPPTTQPINLEEILNQNDETASPPQLDRNETSEEEVAKVPDEKNVNNNNDQNEESGNVSDWSKEEEEAELNENENIPPTQTNGSSTELADRKADSPQFNQYRQPKESWEEEEDKKTVLIKKLKFGFDIEKILEAMQTFGDVSGKKKIDDTEACFTFYDAEDARIAVLQMQNGMDQWQWLLGMDAILQLV